MAMVLKPKKEGGRITYHIRESASNFTSIYPPVREGYITYTEKGNRNFFLNYRRDVLSKYMPSVYKWGEDYDMYTPHPKVMPNHRKERWEEMFSRPNPKMTFKDHVKVSEIEEFYVLCQFQRQSYNDYTQCLHPMDYFQKDVYSWAPPPDFNSNYVLFPQTYVKYKHPIVVPLTTKKVWIEPNEPCKRLAGKIDPYPDLKFPR